jgi:hypothetical protein
MITNRLFYLLIIVLIITACVPQDNVGISSNQTPTAFIKEEQPVATAVINDVQDLVGIIAIGHSGMTGEGSDPTRPGQEAKEYSWATGTSPEVNSVYQRLIAVRPETAGHVANFARGGASVTALLSQAQSSLHSVPNPEIVLIQTIDNDIRCDGSDPENVKVFGGALAEVLQVIVNASPDSHILLVSQQGRPATFAAAVANNALAWPKFVGSGMCDLFNSDGSINHEHIATLTGIIESYEAEQSRVCATVPQCSTDEGVLSRYIDDLADWVEGDWNHLNVRGQARRAEIIWPVIADLLGVK